MTELDDMVQTSSVPNKGPNDITNKPAMQHKRKLTSCACNYCAQIFTTPSL